MRNKRLISKVMVFMLALVLTFTFIPPNLLTVFADDGGGSGGANTSVTEVGSQLDTSGNEYGIRI